MAMAHVMREELVRWRDEGRPEDRERMLSHLATCKSCSETYAELVRTAPARMKPEHFDPADFVKRGYAARQRAAAKASVPVWMSWKMWAGALSAAALVLLVIVTVPGPGSTTNLTRGSRIELVTPATVTAPLSLLEWRSGLAADRFRIELTDANGALVYQGYTSMQQIALPPELAAIFVPGRSYTYTITALDRDGQAVTSASGTISIAGATK
jgi:hypothetical protein